MSNPYFCFKQFTIRHDLSAMKVGTDGVLLGAWANCSEVARILDVGTGSGLIALMLAQRSKAKIQALDIDSGAYRQATYNFNHSPFADRLEVVHVDFRDFESPVKFDLIVSNPPYFSNSLKSLEKNRSNARHNDCLPFDSLMSKSAELLSEKGRLALILPMDACLAVDNAASQLGLFICRKTIVHSTLESPPKRALLEYSFQKQPTQEDRLSLEISRHIYTDEYKQLVKDFYLNL